MGGSRPNAARRLGFHAARVGLFVLTLMLIRWQHQAISVSLAAADFPQLSLSRLQRWFPAAADIIPSQGPGERVVVDQTGHSLGFLIQTSPVADHLVGFSGPTNVLVGFSNAGTIVGVDVISSRDTREHVRQVLADQSFLDTFLGLSWEDAAAMPPIDGVSGATLTSLTMQESMVARLSGGQRSLKFGEDLQRTDVAGLFPKAASLRGDPNHESLWEVFDPNGERLGAVLRTSPHADNIVGYQGPTETLIGFGEDGRVIGLAIRKSFDNEPYVSYVREDEYFLSLFNDLVLAELAAMAVESTDNNGDVIVEGVSGATMTSQAVTEGVFLAAKQLQQSSHRRDETVNATTSAILASLSGIRWRLRDFGTALVVGLGLVVAFTRWRGHKLLRWIFQLAVIGYLGLVNGDLVSQAALLGWARNGIPWKSAGGLVLLTFAAFLIPITTRRNIYCSHLCPHGAVQHLVKLRLPWQVKLSHSFASWLRRLPAALLLWCVIVALGRLSFSLVDIEPFNAWLFQVAGWATIAIAIVGIVASLFIPMAYCRYGCPTGALLGFLRYNGRSDRWTTRDWFALGLVALAGTLFLI